ncbi:MAG: alkaline phosphatase family protein [Myxococcales bacterium]|nr:MAG: alkaline phosphatase family protein [Myxococcales bacterium]
MGARALVVGLDGFDLGLVEQFGSEHLPHLHALMDRGVFAALESVRPPATLPNWTTFLTGVDPARHGVFDFTTRKGYRVRFSAGTARQVPTVFKRLDALGLRCACLSFPATWPPEELEHGIFVSGWDAPVAFEADRSFMWPPSLYDETVRRFGAPTFDDVNEFHADAPGWIDRLPEALERRVARKAGWARWLLARQDWDVFAVYFGESDTASHYLWAHHDPRSPRRPASVTPHQKHGLLRVYEALDEAVGSLLEAAGGNETEITVLSDHGSGGSSDKVLYLNRLLAEHGLLRFRKQRGRHGAGLKEIALRRFPPRLREKFFRAGNAWLPSRLESNVRFGAIDMQNTVAFSDELNYFPGIHLNMSGREPHGIVRPEQRGETLLQVRAALLSTRDPWTGRPVFADVVPREELFEGPHLDRAPDLLLDLHLDDGYSYNLMPSEPGPRQSRVWASAAPWRQSRFTGHHAAGNPFRKLTDAEKLGKKGRSLPGSHRSHGFMTLAGPSIRAVGRLDAHIADLSATLLCRLGLSVPPSFKGRVLWEALRDALGASARPIPEAAPLTPHATRNEALVESRLRALGYIE